MEKNLTFTLPVDTFSLSQDLLKQGGLIMKGVILCTKCRKKMQKNVCTCGNPKCLIRIYWNGQHYEYRRDNDGDVLTYDKALKKLIDISHAVKTKTFNPFEYSDTAIKERKFEYQIEKWLDEKLKMEKAGELSYGTTRNYRGYCKNYFHFFHKMDVRDIRLEQLTNFKDTLENISIKTRKNIFIALRNFFGWLRKRGIIKELPIFPEIKGDDSKPRVAIDVDTQEIALKRIPEEHRDPIEFLMETGLRPGEVCALLVDHIDIRNKTARIERTYVSSHLIRETTKQRRKRIIPLSDRAFEIAYKNMIGKISKQFLFINPITKKGYYPTSLWTIWKKYSGLDIDLYSATRHSFASQLIQYNDVAVVKELMGHSDIATTQKYLHMKIVNLAEVVNSRKIYQFHTILME